MPACVQSACRIRLSLGEWAFSESRGLVVINNNNLFKISILAFVFALPVGIIHADTGAGQHLHELFDAQWQRDLKENPTLASSLGDRRYNKEWPDLRLASIAASHAADSKALVDLHAIPYDDLSTEDQLNYELFGREYQRRVDAYKYRQFLIPLNQRGGIQTANELTEVLRFANVNDYEDWIARMRNLEVYAIQMTRLMRRGIEEGRIHPRIIMQRVPAQIETQIVDAPEQSPFYTPFDDMPDSISEKNQKRLRKEAANVIRHDVIPVYKKFLKFFVNDYLPACREDIGAWALPNGEQFYQFRVESFTTTKLTADEIHQIGEREVERIRAEMMKVIDQVGFQGSFDEFLHFLRTDPQFYFDNPDDLYTEYLATSKRIDPELVKLFGKLPRMPYGVKPIPAASAPDTTTAYYSRAAADGSRAGYYYVNLYKPEVRPKFEMEALTVHEAMPGHHLQIALMQELGDVPDFRRFLGFTAFVEGWGLYSESLGPELGLYKDPYSKFGQLTYEMWRAVRLVVDTGMHHKKWTRQQAIDFFTANAAKTEHDIINEIDRYIAWPGQALAYKIGELKIKELRAWSSSELGSAFDIRGFHDTVLGSGAVPLDILQANVENWVREVKAQQ